MPVAPIADPSSADTLIDTLPLSLPLGPRWQGHDEDDQHNRERRRRARLRVEQTVKLFDPTSNRYFAGHTRDISERGFCLELPARMPARAGHTALLHVASESRGLGLVPQQALVPIRYVWVRREADGANQRCICGVEVLTETAAARNAA